MPSSVEWFRVLILYPVNAEILISTDLFHNSTQLDGHATAAMMTGNGLIYLIRVYIWRDMQVTREYIIRPDCATYVLIRAPVRAGQA